MAVREITPPAAGRNRRAKHPFKADEVKEAIKMLKAGKTPGVGPFTGEGDTGIKEARSASQSLVRHVAQVEPDLNVGTRAWEDEDGNCFAVLRIKD